MLSLCIWLAKCIIMFCSLSYNSKIALFKSLPIVTRLYERFNFASLEKTEKKLEKNENASAKDESLSSVVYYFAGQILLLFNFF